MVKYTTTSDIGSSHDNLSEYLLFNWFFNLSLGNAKKTYLTSTIVMCGFVRYETRIFELWHKDFIRRMMTSVKT